jgi:hypothetical protein
VSGSDFNWLRVGVNVVFTLVGLRLEPHVADAAAVRGQVLPGIVAIKMVDGEVEERCGIGHPAFDRDPAAAVGPGLARHVEKHRAAGRAEVEFKLGPVGTTVGAGSARDGDIPAEEAICPKRAGAATDRAAAGSDRGRGFGQGPAAGATMAGSAVHRSPWISWRPGYHDRRCRHRRTSISPRRGPPSPRRRWRRPRLRRPGGRGRSGGQNPSGPSAGTVRCVSPHVPRGQRCSRRPRGRRR